MISWVDRQWAIQGARAAFVRPEKRSDIEEFLARCQTTTKSLTRPMRI